jgi:probable HAF family extracellular repeat protein
MTLKVVTAGLALATVSAGSSQEYSVTVIDGLPMAQQTGLSDINDEGQILGYSRFPIFGYRSFVYEDGVITELGTLARTETLAQKINSNGTVVGYTRSYSSIRRAFVWTREGGMEPLVPGLYESWANDINDSGDIVGNSIAVSGGYIRGFFHRAGRFELLPIPSQATSSWASAINDDGVIVGYGNWASSPYLNPAKWVNGVVSNMTGYLYSFPSSINADGTIVGMTWGHYYPLTERPVAWIKGNYTELAAGPTGVGGCHDVNDVGMIVGWVYDSSYNNRYGTVWRDGQITVLDSLQGPSRSFRLQRAVAINNSGKIVGTGTLNGKSVGVLLTPIGD